MLDKGTFVHVVPTNGLLEYVLSSQDKGSLKIPSATIGVCVCVYIYTHTICHFNVVEWTMLKLTPFILLGNPYIEGTLYLKISSS